MNAKGRPPADPKRKAIQDRLRVLDRGLIACYEIIDRIRKEKAELEAQPKMREPFRSHYAKPLADQTERCGEGVQPPDGETER